MKGHNCEPGFPMIPLISHTEIYGLFFLVSTVYVIQPYTIRRHMMGDPRLVIGLREATKLKRPRLQGAAGLLQQLVPNKSLSNSWFSSEKKLHLPNHFRDEMFFSHVTMWLITGIRRVCWRSLRSLLGSQEQKSRLGEAICSSHIYGDHIGLAMED